MSALLLWPLAGCIAFGGDACAVVVPSATSGSQFFYAASGNFFGLEAPVRVSEEIRPEFSSGAFQEDSRLRVEIGRETEPRLSSGGVERSSFRLSFIYVPVQGPEFEFRVEYLDAETGDVIQVVHPLGSSNDGAPLSETLFVNPGLPSLFGVGLLWNQRIDKGFRGHADFAPPVYFPGEVAANRWSRLTLHHDSSTVTPDDSCQVTLGGTISGGRYARYAPVTIKATFGEGLAVATSFEVQFTDAPRTRLALTLLDAKAADGRILPSFRPREASDGYNDSTNLTLRPLRDGFLEGGDQLFPTPYSTAIARIRDDEEARRWFESHPDAILADGIHRNGDPETSLVDAWFLSWYSREPTGGATGIVEKHQYDPPAAILQPEFQVAFNEHAVDPVDRAPTRGPTLDELAKVVRNTHKGSLEYVFCYMGDGICTVGGFAATGMQPARPGEGLGAGLLPGLRVSLDDGLLLMNTQRQG